MGVPEDQLPPELRSVVPLALEDAQTIATFSASIDAQPSLGQSLAASLRDPNSQAEVGHQPIPAQAGYHARMALMAGLSATGVLESHYVPMLFENIFRSGDWTQLHEDVHEAAERMYVSVTGEPASAVPSERLTPLIEFALFQLFSGWLSAPRGRRKRGLRRRR